MVSCHDIKELVFESVYQLLMQVIELEKNGGGDMTGNNNLQQRVNELTDKMHALERNNQTKQDVCGIFGILPVYVLEIM